MRVLQAPKFDLPDLDRRPGQAAARKIKSLNKRLGQGTLRSLAFEDSVNRIASVLRQSGPDAASLCIEHPRDIRAYAEVLAQEDIQECRLAFAQAIANRIKNIRPTLSDLTVRTLLGAYFRNFGRIRSASTRQSFERFLRDALVSLVDSRPTHRLSRLANRSEPLLQDSGPERIAKQSIKADKSIDVELKFYGIDQWGDTRYRHACRAQYVLQKLRVLAVGSDAPILGELRSRELVEASVGGGKLVGHLAVETLIDRTRGAPGEAWLDTILAIAGDPRVSRRSQNFSKWWSQLGDKRIARVRGWLSRVDIRLFLRVIEDIGKDSGNKDLQRMFPDRKRLLEGLLDQDLVIGSRLFLSPEPERYIRGRFDKDELPNFARAQDPANRAFIYLELTKGHLVEGSHNRTLHILPHLPPRSVIEDFESDAIPERKLGNGLVEAFDKAYPGMRGRRASIQHNGSWDHRAVMALNELGLRFRPEQLLSPNSYRDYRRSYVI